jgi:dolichol-phosphate mannosyltransferase
MNDCIVIIPPITKLKILKALSDRCFLNKPFHILIVDDNSPDHTAEQVKLLQAEFESRLFFWKTEKKSGLERPTSMALVGIEQWL